MTRIVSVIALIAMMFGFLAFQCSSKEITSAKLYIQQKNLPKAKEVLLQEVEKNPKSAEGFYLLGYVYGEDNDLENMLINFDKSLEISQDFKKNIEDSKKYHWANSFNQGVGFFNKANNTSSKDSSNMFYGKAIESFNVAIKCQPDSIDNYRNLTYVYLNAGRYNEAISPLEKLIELEGSAESYNRLGEVYIQLATTCEDSVKSAGFYSKADEILNKGLQKNPGSGEILVSLANVYISTDRAAEAESLIKQLVEKDPENPDFSYSYGVLLLQKDNFEEAVKYLEKANSLNPSSELTLYNLASAYINWGVKIRQDAEDKGIATEEHKEKFKKALPFLEEYLRIKPEEALIWEKLGQVYAQLGETEKSQDAFKKADEYRK